MRNVWGRTLWAGALPALAVLLGFSAIGGARPVAAHAPDGSTLTGVVWQWQQTLLSGSATMPDDPSRYTLEFLPDGKVSLRADCNRGGGSYDVRDFHLTFGALFTTLIGCPPGSLGGEYGEQLSHAAFWAVDGDRLAIGLAPEAGVMFFTKPAAARVSGTVTYRQRIALPADAVITVRVEDTSRADAPAVLVGEQRIESTGRQVPIPFSVAYDPSTISASGRYTLRARIESADGRLLWLTTQAYPVLTMGNPTSDIELDVQMPG